ncbi:type IV toxin-antitoxin system AbiEi family antitoxin domain-containing protein [Flavonifractor sp. HCP28S3_F3]|uniref:type IV toxin-antitoxin system AbiEi family antitoxin domain-containing protein n=1 Tax=Flavonifractor sp. HCP28S3_F3 TaxID=3438939 RepID=UPI003F8C0203
MYYQDGKRLTLAAADRKAITEWVRDYLVSGSAPFPLSGAIPAADFKFVIDYNTDVELMDSRDLKDPDEMAKYNRETNAARNKEKGKKKVQTRFSAACGAIKVGDTLTTKQLVEMGYTDDKARKRLVDSGVLKRIKRGHYLVLSV